MDRLASIYIVSSPGQIKAYLGQTHSAPPLLQEGPFSQERVEDRIGMNTDMRLQ
ncbi:hypothetical protein MASR2M78_05630 [Treponema sp.]